MSEEDVTDLRARLLYMRVTLVERLADRIEGGDLALLASVGGALAALDAMREAE